MIIIKYKENEEYSENEVLFEDKEEYEFTELQQRARGYNGSIGYCIDGQVDISIPILMWTKKPETDSLEIVFERIDNETFKKVHHLASRSDNECIENSNSE